MKICGMPVGFLCLLSLLFSSCGRYQEEVSCGDGVVGAGEQCDRDNLDGNTCEDLGHDGGELTCTDGCTFDESGCQNWPSLTINVKTSSPETGDGVPLQGATVALDAPGGERFEQVTGADGKATFEGIDWSVGLFTASAHMEGYNIVTFAGFDAVATIEAGEPSTYLMNITSEPPESLTVTGTATGLVDPGHSYIVNVQRSWVASQWWGNSFETFTATVPRDAPFTLQGVEYEGTYPGPGIDMPIYRVMQMDFDPITEDISNLVLDFAAHEVQTHTADVWFSMPPRAASPLRTGTPACYVFDESPYPLGWAIRANISADGNLFDALLLWSEPSWVVDVTTQCIVYSQGMGSSTTFAAGFPQPGKMYDLMDVPRWISPADPATPYPLHGTLEWELFDQGVEPQLVIWDVNKPIWIVYVADDAETLTLPEPPSSVDPITFLGTEPRPAVLYFGDVDESRTHWKHLVSSQSILLSP
jgi:hypothetical protein